MIKSFDLGVLAGSTNDEIWSECAKLHPGVEALRILHESVCSCSPDRKISCFRGFVQKGIVDAEDAGRGTCMKILDAIAGMTDVDQIELTIFEVIVHAMRDALYQPSNAVH